MPEYGEVMNADDIILLVQRYFSAVDQQELETVLSTLTPDCRFSVETHGVVLNGHAEITGMFERLWDAHAAVLHDQFVYVPDPANRRIACRFQVTNTLPDGSTVHKSNCNFFEVRDGLFSAVAVYMTGENTLNRG